MEKEGLRHLTGTGRQPVTVIKVPHHGARSSLDRDWLKDIQPQYAVISVGRGNPYGHPVPEVLEAYAREHVTVSRTDLDGAIWITGRLFPPRTRGDEYARYVALSGRSSYRSMAQRAEELGSALAQAFVSRRSSWAPRLNLTEIPSTICPRTLVGKGGQFFVHA